MNIYFNRRKMYIDARALLFFLETLINLPKELKSNEIAQL